MGLPIKVSMVGYGNHGKTLLRKLCGMQEQFDVVGIYSRSMSDVSTELDGKIISVHPLSEFGSRGEELVCVVTPDTDHLAWIQRCAEKGIYCFVEKPMVHRLEEVKKLAGMGDSLSRIFVGHQYRRMAWSRKIKSYLDSGALGKLINIEIHLSHGGVYNISKTNWRLSETLHPEGPLNTLGSHCVDLLHYWGGSIGSVFGFLTNHSGISKGVADTSLFCGQLSCGASFVVQNNYCQCSEKRFVLTGTEGTLYFLEGATYLRQGRDQGRVPSEKHCVMTAEEGLAVDPFREQFSEIYQCMREGRPRFETDFHAGAKVVQVIDAVMQSARHGKAVVLPTDR